MCENIVGELTAEQKAGVKSWCAELDEWWTKHQGDEVSDTIAAGNRYRIMLSLRKELNDRVRVAIGCHCLSVLTIFVGTMDG
jgi:hypothetical protein